MRGRRHRARSKRLGHLCCHCPAEQCSHPAKDWLSTGNKTSRAAAATTAAINYRLRVHPSIHPHQHRQKQSDGELENDREIVGKGKIFSERRIGRTTTQKGLGGGPDGGIMRALTVGSWNCLLTAADDTRALSNSPLIRFRFDFRFQFLVRFQFSVRSGEVGET